MKDTRIPLPHVKAVLRLHAANTRPRRHKTPMWPVAAVYVASRFSVMLVFISTACHKEHRCKP